MTCQNCKHNIAQRGWCDLRDVPTWGAQYADNNKIGEGWLQECGQHAELPACHLFVGNCQHADLADECRKGNHGDARDCSHRVEVCQ